MNELNEDNLKTEIIKLIKEVYQDGFKDGKNNEPAFDDGMEVDLWGELNVIFDNCRERRMK